MDGTHRLARILFVSVGVLVLCGLVAPAAFAGPAPQTSPGDPLDPRTTDPGAKLFLIAHATGVQKYLCQPSGTWVLTDPEATLFKTVGTSKPIGTHFLNFTTGRPVWQYQDGSSVEAARVVAVPNGAANIALLLLQGVVTTVGDEGDRLAGTAWVQRLNTSGGVAPPGACTPGDRTQVDYAADYFFWR
jgi:hypothetical protein